MRKSKLAITGIVCVVSIFALQTLLHKEPSSMQAVMDSLWENHHVQSIHVGDTDSVIAVSIFDKEEIAKVEKYLEQNLSKEKLEHYSLHVFLYSPDDKEFRDNARGL
ncbi:hypothetical protein [Geomicrobium sediminis]|uniref:Low affinity Fe/Cu permease n=1 Tax=Geomicrobium sediminis TaxID=1347788 RepID=A0ABS2PAL2_9BACL|nr:hypothetical protein [Geomicrobium sediminis]MBM7632357.1 low affinity Fe/Cu permease [Geomicrobium sediminis]